MLETLGNVETRAAGGSLGFVTTQQDDDDGGGGVGSGGGCNPTINPVSFCFTRRSRAIKTARDNFKGMMYIYTGAGTSEL